MDEILLYQIIQKLDVIEQKLEREKKLLTVDEVSQMFGITKSYLYKLTSARKIPHFKPTGKKIYFDYDELVEWMKRNRISTMDEIREEAHSHFKKL